MEEDKKYLKDQIKRIKLEYMPCELFVFDRLIQAIENILNRLEQDERVIEEMAKHICVLGDCPLDRFDKDLDCENRCRTDDGIYKECWEMYFRKKCE